LINRLKPAADRIALKKLPYYGPEGEAMAAQMLGLSRTRVVSFARPVAPAKT
jgi:hypothetical protein